MPDLRASAGKGGDGWDSRDLVAWLSSPAAYPERPSRVERVDTHISWVFLTDRYAYKLKRPVRFPFVDFSTPQQRHQACIDEVRLNRRLAPEVYLAVLPVTVSGTGHLQLGGSTEPVDWLVQMRRLPAAAALDQLVHMRCLTAAHIQQLADRLATFYQMLPPVTIGIDQYRRQLEQAVRSTRDRLLAQPDRFPVPLVTRVHQAQVRLLRLAPALLDDRVRDGRIVEGHGDLRPEHIYFDPHPLVIDCIEFSAELRRLDVLDELAFLSMESDRLGASEIGRRVLERYQQISGDRAGQLLLTFYKIYRACVRAHVLSLQADQLETRHREEILDQARHYLQLADCYVHKLGPPFLLLVCGLPGTGKSTLATALAEKLSVHLLQTDKGRTLEQRRRQMVSDQQVLEQTGPLLDENLSVVVDGTFLSASLREQAVELARHCGAAPLIVQCHCPEELAIKRLADRLLRGWSLSEARPHLLQLLRQADQPLPSHCPVYRVDTTASLPVTVQKVLEQLAQLILPKQTMIGTSPRQL